MYTHMSGIMMALINVLTYRVDSLANPFSTSIKYRSRRLPKNSALLRFQTLFIA